MKTKLITLLICGSISLVSFSGCESGPSAQNGATWGALTGAALGAIIGHQSGDGGEGAAIGAVVGGAIGHAVGDEQDRQYNETQHYQAELEIAQARRARAEEEAERQRMIVAGTHTEDSEVLAAKQRAEAAEALPIVRLETNLGNIDMELYPAYAPITVGNFLRLVDDGFYDGLIFHRVIEVS